VTTATWKPAADSRESVGWRFLQGLFLVAVVGLAGVGAWTNSPRIAMAALACGLAYVAIYTLWSWHGLVGLLFAVIWFIPIKRYQFPVHLPFDLEPYRVLVAFLVLVWVSGLLIDPGLRLRRTGIETPLLAFFLVILVSISVNFRLVESLGVTVDVIKTLSFFASFILTFFIVVTVTRTRDDLYFLVRFLVGAGAIVAATAVVEYRTGFNVFNHLSQVFPFLTFEGALTDVARSDRLRVYASSQHPIAFAAAMMMMVPVAIALAMTTKKLRWWCATFLLGMGSLATLSRTGITMFIAASVVFTLYRPLEAKRLLPLFIPAFAVVFLALPQALGTLESAFFPKGGLISDQQTVAAAGVGHESGRLATLGPGIKLWEKRPFFGQGFGTRVIDLQNPGKTNSNVLDDQWLGSLLETGAFGVLTLIWVFVRSARRLGRVARSATSPDGLLAAGLAASLVSFGVGAVTYDAFGFIQVTFLFFIVLALAGGLLRINADAAQARVRPVVGKVA
jgi:polysaccharide biosynthesis protein PslJ